MRRPWQLRTGTGSRGSIEGSGDLSMVMTPERKLGGRSLLGLRFKEIAWVC